MPQPIDGSARFFAWFAALVWVIVALAVVALALGEEDAINALIGAGPGALFLTGAAIGLHRQDRRHPRTPPST